MNNSNMDVTDTTSKQCIPHFHCGFLFHRSCIIFLLLLKLCHINWISGAKTFYKLNLNITNIPNTAMKNVYLRFISQRILVFLTIKFTL